MSGEQSAPSNKMLKLSISYFLNDPKIISVADYEKKTRKFGHDNYITHLRRFIAILRKTTPSMNEDEILALKADTAGLIDFLDDLFNASKDGR